MSKRHSESEHEPYEGDAIAAFASELGDDQPAALEVQPRSAVSPTPPRPTLVIASPPMWPDTSFEQPDVSLTLARRRSSSPGWRRIVRPMALTMSFFAGAMAAVLIQQRWAAAPESTASPQSDGAPSIAIQAPVPQATAPSLPPPVKTVVQPETISEPLEASAKESARAVNTPGTARAVTAVTPTPTTRTPSSPSSSAPSAAEAKQTTISPSRIVDVSEPAPRPAALVPVEVPPTETKETATTARIDEPPIVTAPAPSPPPASDDPSPSTVAPREDAAVVRRSAIELDTTAIQGTLNRYRTAFNALDASKAAQIWPSVDERALARAFERLEEQVVSLGVCRIDVKASRAQATCSGTLRYVPRIGSQTAHVDRRQWTFDLRKARGEWLIERVDAR